MLQDLIKDLQSSLKSYSLGLANKNLLVDIPWTMVDGDLNLQRLIFRKEKSLYIVKEGEIHESTWEYLPAMNSLAITLSGKKIMVNEVFADGKALILKRDGLNQSFTAFVNAKEIPDLDLLSYLKSLFHQETEPEIEIENEKTIYPFPKKSKKQKPPVDPRHRKKENLILVGILFAIILLVISLMLFTK